jgi:hypothetical protein
MIFYSFYSGAAQANEFIKNKIYLFSSVLCPDNSILEVKKIYIKRYWVILTSAIVIKGRFYGSKNLS